MLWRILRWGLTALLAIAIPATAGMLSTSSIPVSSTITAQYGSAGLARIQRWQTLMQELRGRPVQVQLARVNDFFNQLDFVDDSVVWHREDYWATPIEFLGVGRGDCEEFALAKYLTLRELGVPDEQMRLHYVKYVPYDQYHMVVSWTSDPRQMPVILDNIDRTIVPAASRRDLIPIYSFNASSLWTSTATGREAPVGDASRLSRWEDWQIRVRNGVMRTP
ncbi:sulfate adenylyltransferase [Kushneria pakistanensis]|uniref:Sulfate adenylyltransferase n=1 Tax=Kushneria pakistanensis TaxID=1508770 RepID=A0ABQ3F8Y4_9GAMM|nr:transglutaminase-like cysteine peptidase [Kushneria pakistanensis]GHC14562.1 sulfate adenylyltransferase [Kushneria pakistanensis]